MALLLRKLADGSIIYPYGVWQLRRDHETTQGLPADLTGEDLSFLGVWPVDEVEPPAVSPGQKITQPIGADGVEQYAPGRWRQVWTVSSRTATELAEAKDARKTEVDAKRDQVMSAGFVPATGPLAGHRLQTRNLDDRTNWLTSQTAYSAAVAGGDGDVMGASFRTADNQTLTISYTDGLQALLAMAAWGAEVMARSWALKDDDIDGAVSFDELAAIDIAAGWPS